MVDDDLTYRIIGCAMKVHRTLGGGFQEVIYQRALAIEMDRAGIDFAGKSSSPSITREWRSVPEGLTSSQKIASWWS